MIIDLKKCVGCNACAIACKVEHNTPNNILYTKVLEKEVGKFPSATRIFYPTLCNHCEDPPCVPVCPTKASHQRDDGIVLIDYNRCIGCGACILACPYDQRVNVKDNRTVLPDNKTLFENYAHAKVPKGVTTKCDFCYHRVDKGNKPACVECCPTEARVFGEWESGDDPLIERVNRNNPHGLLEDKGTGPKVLYIE